eukprot:3501-Heterococcus_DN1.PRE.2
MLTQLCTSAEPDSDATTDVAADDATPTAAVCAISNYLTRLRSTVAHTALLAVHTEACSSNTIQSHCSTAVHTDSSNSSSSSTSSAGSNNSSVITRTVQKSNSITVQLVHAVTGVKAAKLYKLELHALERLLTVHSSAEQTLSVLLNLLRTPTGWRTTQEQQQHCDTTIELKYDGDVFTEEGFDCVIQCVYGGMLNGVTLGLLDTDKAAVVLQAADFFELTALRQATEQFAQRCGATLASDT